MRVLALIAVAACAAACFAQSVKPDGVAADETYARSFNQNNQETISGAVVGKVKGAASGYSQGMGILVRTAGGEVLSVDLGPAWYVADQKTRIKMGDHVTVTGSPVIFSDGENVILARAVRKGDSVMALRDPSGAPYWDEYVTQATRPSKTAATVASKTTAQPSAAATQTAPIAPTVPWYFMPTQIGPNAIVTGMAPISFGNVVLAGGYGGAIVTGPPGMRYRILGY